MQRVFAISEVPGSQPGTSSAGSKDSIRIGIIGAGNIGHALAVRFAAAGHEVMLSNSRGPDTLAEVVGSIDGNVSAGSATRHADLQDFSDGSDGTRTRDLRRDRPAF
jgi:3-hydroxyacyl-CoA dehydrogenase